ncbi:MAG: hypothetical protein HUJ90_01035, partial [Bacteroidales bacterium]|nr:hypothetical protein [Bacteroidales bacterium]
MKKIAFSFIFLCICTLAVAQIDPMVEVNRAYETRLNDKTKPIMPVTISDSLGRFDIGFDYSIFDRPYTDLYEFSPYQAAELQKVEPERFSYLSVKAGAQVPFIPSLSIYGQLIPSSNVNLGITGVYDSHIGKVTNLIGNKMNTSRTNAGVGLNAKFAWKSGELDLAGGYNIAKASDGPAANELVVKHNVDQINASFRITSANPATNSFYYNASLEFNRTGKSMNEYALPQYNYKESQLDAAARFGATFGDYRLYVDFKNR